MNEPLADPTVEPTGQPAADPATEDPNASQSVPPNPDDLRWELSYDRASIDRFLADVEDERTRLQQEIRAVRSQAETANANIASRQTESEAALGALVVAAQQEFARIEESHREVLQTIREAAASEAARVLTAAHREAAAVREATASLAVMVAGGTVEPSEAAPTPSRQDPIDAP